MENYQTDWEIMELRKKYRKFVQSYDLTASV